MTQRGAVFLGPTVVQIEFPGSNEEVLPDLPWGAIDAFPTPAYWAYQVIARRIGGWPIRCRLGHSLREEVAACLLGGHGIPASVGVAAFQRLKARGCLEGHPTEGGLLAQLSEPLLVDGRAVRYRFARQKARYLSGALQRLADASPPTDSGRALRDWLIDLPGVGPKTASWIARNWLDADDIAILDIHVLRAGALGGFLDAGLTVERHYLQLEAQFLCFAHALGVRPPELDAVIWSEMMSSPATVRRLSSGRLPAVSAPSGSRRRAHVGCAHTDQARLIE